jgi:hypothetical protein
MGDAFWDSIKGEKQEVIDNLKEFCTTFGLEMPEVNTKMRLDVLHSISNETRKKIFGTK